MINAFTTDADIEKTLLSGATKVTLVTDNDAVLAGGGSNTVLYKRFRTKADLSGNKIYLPSLFVDDGALDSLIDYVLGRRASFMVSAAVTLEEVGLIESRYKLSPIMLLHKLGLLTDSVIVGGVFLDNDDVDLMVQENSRLVLTLSHSAGYGHGIANISSYLKRGLKVNLGTADNRFNIAASPEYEARLAVLFSNAAMHSQLSLSDEDIHKMLYEC